MAVNKGREGELLFKQFMESRGYIVQDVSNNPDYYYSGDLLITSPTTGITKRVEVKYDYRIHETNNLYLEIINMNSIGGCGWYDFTKADYVAYGDAINKKFYIYSMDALRQRVQQLPKVHKECGKDSVGLIATLKQVQSVLIEEVQL